MMPFAATRMDLEIIILSDVSQTEKDKHHDLAYVWSLRKSYKWIYLQNINRPTDIENKYMVTKRERAGRDKLRGWDQHTFTTIYKIDDQQGPIV